MREEKVVQFVCFETPLNTEQFIAKWEQFTRSADSDLDVKLQQSEKNGLFKYLVQHRCKSGEFQFVFQRARRSSKTREVPLRVEQAGGYSIVQFTRTTEARRGESKLFVFLIDAPTDLGSYKQLSIPNELNIYQPYYENCRYACILEYFTKDKTAEALMEELKKFTTAEVSIYKECSLQLS